MKRRTCYFIIGTIMLGIVFLFIWYKTNETSALESERENSIYIDQLRTFYDADGTPFKILIQPRSPSNRIMSVSILDNANNFLYELDACSVPPYNYYDDFLDMSYVDVIGDNREDIVIWALFSTGIGTNGAVPYRRCVVYENTSDGYTLNLDASKMLTEKET